MSILFPFIYYMVRDFDICTEKDIGFYVGFIASSFSLAQLCTTMGWGWMSDRIGRRPVLLIGLLGNAVTMLFFGLSKTLVWAILARSTCGFLNGNVGVAKCVLGEISDKSNRGMAFSCFGFCFGVGMVAGPAIGGLLQQPVENGYISGEFFENYPYFLPCAISACISAIGFVAGLFFLPETCKALKYRQIPYDPEETEPILSASHIDLTSANRESIARESVSVSLPANISTYSLYVALAYGLLALQSVLFTEVYPLWAGTFI
jgi:MFS family permease